MEREGKERLLKEGVIVFCELKRLLDSVPPSRAERERCRIEGPPEGFRHIVRHLDD
jgi:hypothetical protein